MVNHLLSLIEIFLYFAMTSTRIIRNRYSIKFDYFYPTGILWVKEKRGYINSTYIKVSSFRLLGYHTSYQSSSLTHDYLQYFKELFNFMLVVLFFTIMANGLRI